MNALLNELMAKEVGKNDGAFLPSAVRPKQPLVTHFAECLQRLHRGYRLFDDSEQVVGITGTSTKHRRRLFVGLIAYSPCATSPAGFRPLHRAILAAC